MSFDWSEEVATVGSWILILYFVYVIASVIPPSDSETTPLFTQEHTKKIINKQYEYLGKPIVKARGLYTQNLKILDGILHYEYVPIINPVEVIHKSEAYIIVLNSLNTGSADKLILYLEKVILEAKYMLYNECTTLIVTG